VVTQASEALEKAGDGALRELSIKVSSDGERSK